MMCSDDCEMMFGVCASRYGTTQCLVLTNVLERQLTTNSTKLKQLQSQCSFQLPSPAANDHRRRAVIQRSSSTAVSPSKSLRAVNWMLSELLDRSGNLKNWRIVTKGHRNVINLMNVRALHGSCQIKNLIYMLFVFWSIRLNVFSLTGHTILWRHTSQPISRLGTEETKQEENKYLPASQR